jgi:hypothetical protein
MTDPIEDLVRSALGNRAAQVHSVPPPLESLQFRTPSSYPAPPVRSGRIAKPLFAALAAAAAILMVVGGGVLIRNYNDSKPADPAPATPSPTVSVPSPTTGVSTTLSVTPSATVSPTSSVAVVPTKFVAIPAGSREINVYETATTKKLETLYTRPASGGLSVILGDDGALYGVGSDPAIGADATGLWKLPGQGKKPALLVRKASDAEQWLGIGEQAGTIAMLITTSDSAKILLVSTSGEILRRIAYVFDARDANDGNFDAGSRAATFADIVWRGLVLLSDGRLAIATNHGQSCPEYFLVDVRTADTTANAQHMSALQECAYGMVLTADGLMVSGEIHLMVVDPTTFKVIRNVSSLPENSYVSPVLYTSASGAVLGERKPLGSTPRYDSDSTPFYLSSGVLTSIPLPPSAIDSHGTLAGAHVLGWWPGS